MNYLAKIFFAAIFLVSIASCEKKSCKNVSCPSPQVCYEGQCVCPDGYEGTNCSVLSSDKYTGNWTVNETTCSGNAPNFTTYSTYIGASGTNSPANFITIYSLLGQGSVTAEILNTNSANEGTTVYIPQQNLGGITIYASYGTYYPAGQQGANAQILINLNYAYNGGISYQCTEIFYKQ